jgi:hypothetical protein
MAGLKAIWGVDFNATHRDVKGHLPPLDQLPEAKMYKRWADEVCRLPDPESLVV